LPPAFKTKQNWDKRSTAKKKIVNIYDETDKGKDKKGRPLQKKKPLL